MVAAREYQTLVATVSLQHLKLFLRFDCPEAIHVRHKYHKNQQTQVDKVRDGRLLAVSADYSVAISERLGRSVIVLSPEAPAFSWHGDLADGDLLAMSMSMEPAAA